MGRVSIVGQRAFEETMLAWDRWVAKSFAARTARPIPAGETKKARLCFVRFPTRNASVSCATGNIHFCVAAQCVRWIMIYKASAARGRIIGICGNAEAVRGVDHRDFTGFRYRARAFFIYPPASSTAPFVPFHERELD